MIDRRSSGWHSWPVLGSIAAALIVLGLFVAGELRTAHPMLDSGRFRLSGIRAGAFGNLALFFVLLGLFYVNAQYLHDVKGYAAASASCP